MPIVINGTTGVSGVDGSAGTPALQGGDTNTGIVFGTDTVGVSTGGVQRTTVDSSGRLLVGVGSANANGGILQLTSGITFPATAVAASDANTLDDYEEGTWTPSLGGTATYTTQVGRYTKVGNFVTIQFRIVVNVLGTGSVSSLSGLPFAPAVISAGHYGGYFNLATNVIFLAFYLTPSVTSLTNVSQSTSGATVTNGPSIFGNSAEVIGAATYQVS
jgi:hypothetical protein